MSAPCSVSGCPKKAHARALCQSHYTRMKFGRPMVAAWRRRGSCAHPGCERVVVAHGWCQPHYKYVRRGESPSLAFLTPEARFWSKVSPEPNTGCWLWVGSLNNKGYGQASRGNYQHVLAHRFSWELANGPIPPGLVACHRCDTPMCVNPAHLFLGTQRDNVRDSMRKGRASRPPTHSGETHHKAKLNPAKVLEIRRRYAAGGTSHGKLGREFGVSEAAARAVILRWTWTQVAEASP